MLKQRDAIGQLIAVAPVAFVQGRALIEAQQRLAVFDLHLVEQIVRGLVLDHDGEVSHLTRELQRDRIDRFLDELAKALARHGFAALLRPSWLPLDGLRGLWRAIRLTGLVTKPVR